MNMLMVEKWLKRIGIVLLYAVLIWLGVWMIVSYIGKSVIDIVNGAAILMMVMTSLVKRVTSDDAGANQTLLFSYVFLGVVILWSFIFGSVIHNFSPQFVSGVGQHLLPDFFEDILKTWGQR